MTLQIWKDEYRRGAVSGFRYDGEKYDLMQLILTEESVDDFMAFEQSLEREADLGIYLSPPPPITNYPNSTT